MEHTIIHFTTLHLRSAQVVGAQWVGAARDRRLEVTVSSKKLADWQEQWILKQGYQSITFKTRNRHRNMLLFAIRNGFNITDVMPRASIWKYRILLKKNLQQ